MTRRDLIKQYVDTGVGIPRYQFDKLPNQLKKTYLRKIYLSLGQNIYNYEYYYGELPEEIQLGIVELDPYNIKDIEAPTERVQLFVVGESIDTLEYIENPSEKVQLFAVNKNPSAIGYINNPSEEVQLTAVNKRASSIRYIDNPSERVKQLARDKGY